MRLKKKGHRNFDDRTGQKYWPVEESTMAAWRLENSTELANIRYRRKKTEGQADFWEKRGLRK